MQVAISVNSIDLTSGVDCTPTTPFISFPSTPYAFLDFIFTMSCTVAVEASSVGSGVRI